MLDYGKMKVVDLRELLSARGLALTGKKEDLVARIVENDAQNAPAGAAPAEEEVDWDEETPAATGAGVAPPVGKKEITLDIANETPAIAPVTTSAAEAPKKKPFVFKRVADEFKEAEPAASAEPAPAPTTAPAKEPTPEKIVEEPKEDFAAGLAASKLADEIEKRKARAARFGMPIDESVKTIERGLRFATTDDKDEALTQNVKGLDQALGESRGRKRGQEKAVIAGNDRDRKRSRGDGKGGREQKPQQQQQQQQPKKAGNNSRGSILDDPVEKAKAEARAKKFGAA